MPKPLLLVLVLAVTLASAFIALSQQPDSTTVKKNETEKAINQAKYVYQFEKERNRDFSAGSCLSNALMPGWVLDIAHNPREPVDELLENQCAAYVQGSAQHFVELDTQGNLIKAQ